MLKEIKEICAQTPQIGTKWPFGRPKTRQRAVLGPPEGHQQEQKKGKLGLFRHERSPKGRKARLMAQIWPLGSFDFLQGKESRGQQEEGAQKGIFFSSQMPICAHQRFEGPAEASAGPSQRMYKKCMIRGVFRTAPLLFQASEDDGW